MHIPEQRPDEIQSSSIFMAARPCRADHQLPRSLPRAAPWPHLRVRRTGETGWRCSSHLYPSVQECLLLASDSPSAALAESRSERAMKLDDSCLPHLCQNKVVKSALLSSPRQSPKSQVTHALPARGLWWGICTYRMREVRGDLCCVLRLKDVIRIDGEDG
jgi:hypothetical protein